MSEGIVEFDQLGFSVEGFVATVTLNRPEKHNAIGARMVEEFSAALDAVEASGARAVVLTGAGDRAFCSGVDLKERRAMSADEKWAHNRAINAFANRLARSQVPTIAAINGLALGGGFELTLACDFRLAAEHAAFALPEVGLGIIPGAGGTQRLPRLIGPSRAKEVILTARRIDAPTALAWGILNGVFPAAELPGAANALAEEVAKNSPLSVAHAKAAVDVAVETSFEQGFRFETAAIRATLASPDYEEGLAAFAGKRTPEFPPLTAQDVT
ncbi:enoyl-CoA hydratase/isomerase family protein [Rubrobacter indicoceani]|uniref:enoyl-CoA hydratase/isomerase family protein n=1 Tax=Rubrobacter indicoceani TaxID=2051957 RepID=UPI000E5BC4E4|nr:enoyl-CoA hydratase-related protein [Rubrobacter indicoceani]